MPRFSSNKSRPAIAATLLLILASLVLAACGGSSNASSNSSASSNATATTAQSATSTTATTVKGAAQARTRRGRVGGGANRLKSGAFKQALAKFATCLRANGVKIPAPNTSGKGPIFNTRGVNVTSPKFKAAQLKCASILRNSLRPAPGAAAG